MKKTIRKYAAGFREFGLYVWYMPLELKALLIMVIATTVLIVGVLTDPEPDKVRADSMEVDATQEIGLGHQLVFPHGWHLVTAYTYGTSGAYVQYICQNEQDTTEYRVCTPQIVDK